jgi:hypothetical protein
MNHAHIARYLLTAMLALAGTAPSARAADSPAAGAPSNTVLFIGVPNCDALVEAGKRTSMGKMWEDPAVKDAIKPYMSVATKLKELVARKIGLDNPDDLLVHPHGAMGAFLTMSAPAGDDKEAQVQLGLFADFGENVEAAKRVTDRLVGKLIEEGAQRETVEAAGAEITSLKYAAPESESEGEATTNGENAPGKSAGFASEVVDILKSEKLGLNDMQWMVLQQALGDLRPPEEFALAYAGSRLVLGSNSGVVGDALRALRDGGDASFAGNPAMAMLERRFGKESPVQAAVDVPRLVELLAQADADAAKFVRAAAMDQFGPVAMVVEIAPTAGVESRTRGYWEIRDASRGIGKIVLMPNRRTAPPAFLEADTIMFGLLHLDVPAMVDEIIEIAGRIDPAEADKIRSGMKQTLPDGSPMDIRQDVIGHITGPFFMNLRAASPFGPADCNASLGFNINSRAAIEKLLAQIPAGMFTTREVRGGLVYEFPMVPIMGVGAGMNDSAIVLGTTSAVEGHLRAEGRETGGLADDPLVQRALRELPDQACMIAYGDRRKMFDAQTAIVKSESGKQPTPFGSQAGAWIQFWLREQFLFETIADYQALAKYQGMQMVTLTSESDGLRFEAVELSAAE